MLRSLFIITLVFVPLLAFTQPDSTFNMMDTLLIKSGIRNVYKIKAFNAEQQMVSENYPEAIKILEELVNEHPDNYNLNFKLGYCYLQTRLEKHKAIRFLEKAVQNTTTEYFEDNILDTLAPIESFYYLGKAYHINYQFDQAIDTLTYLRKRLTPEDEELIADIERLAVTCRNAREIEKESLPIILTHFGNGINTEYYEHSPVFNEDESVMYFTSRREGSTGELLLDDGTYFEDIYTSSNRNGVWSAPQRVDRVNTDYNEATIGLSPDGNTLFIYRSAGDDGDIYMSQMGNDGFWSDPQRMPDPINSRFRETHASISASGDVLYFTSDRKEGKGGLDIYRVKKLPNGEWGVPENLAEINTPYNEDAPFLSIDGTRLYFSSEGHMNMGGYDIFYSEIDADGKLQVPVNMGYPINTTEDDAYYVPTSDGYRAYYSTYNTGGLGKSDIFMISIPGKQENNLAAISGVLSLSHDSTIKASITVFDFNTGDLLGRYAPNPVTGKYLLILPPGQTYKVLYEAPSYYPVTDNLFVDPNSPYHLINKVITLQHKTLVKNPTGEQYDRDTTFISDILFEFDKNEIDAVMLDRLAQCLIDNKDAIIEIGGHADVNGPEIYNIHLSLRRAIFVNNYLLNKGVQAVQLVVRGYGERYPLIADIPEGAQYEHLHKYNRRVEFKVIKEGRDVLSIRKIDLPESIVGKSRNNEADVLTDSDNDGIPDKDDACPKIAGVSSNNGCPEVKEEVKEVLVQAMEGLFFNTGSAVIKKSSYKVLDNVARIMKENVSFKLKISGHTDDQGDPGLNLTLSKDRAKAAMEYLVKEGITRDRIISEGFGMNEPVDSNATEEGRAKNRRVEFEIIF